VKRWHCKLNVAESAALAVLVISVLAMMVKSLWLNDVPAPYEWLAKLSVMGDSVFTSLIAGSLFFLIVNVLFDRAEFARVRPVLQMRFRQVSGQYEGLMRDMAAAANVEILDDVYAIDIDTILDRLNPNDTAPIIANLQGDYLNWIGAMKHWSNRARMFLGKIERRSNLLTADSLELLDRVHDSPYFGQVDSITTPIRNTNFEFMRSTLTQYRDLMSEVKAHAELL
jgi:hypothetical protein